MRRALLLAALTLTQSAAAFEFRGAIEGEGRVFPQRESMAGDGSAAGRIEFFQDFLGTQRIAGELFQRVDGRDPARTHGDVRELYWQTAAETWEARAGVRRVYWGVTESRHLVDVLNQTDFVDNLDGKTRLGAPMLDLALIRGFGTLDVFALPYQRDRTFPGRNGHPRFPFPVDAHDAQYGARHGQRHLDFAARWSHTLGPVDFGVSWFDGLARDPRLRPCLRRGSGFAGTQNGPNCDIFSGIVVPTSPFPSALVPVLQQVGLAPSDDEVAAQIAADVRRNLVLVPFYDRLRQLSFDGQAVVGSLALKLEALHREQRGGSWAAVTGFEYTFGDVAGSGTDVGVLAEYLYDRMDDPLRRFDDELFVGTRVALSDVGGTSLLAGMLVDRRRFDDRLWGVEASSRLTDDWKVSLEARLFEKIPQDSPADFLEGEDVVTVRLERFF
ncbi:MAG TPA: hypothetical protein VM369_01990 [Candidatus Binatia bacterium]|nr:hypothetical protein [Candidatus Binatia bacterium]